MATDDAEATVARAVTVEEGRDVEIVWRGNRFTGARGQHNADEFETEGVNIRARKP
jgi:hypothetical protein